MRNLNAALGREERLMGQIELAQTAAPGVRAELEALEALQAEELARHEAMNASLLELDAAREAADSVYCGLSRRKTPRSANWKWLSWPRSQGAFRQHRTRRNTSCLR